MVSIIIPTYNRAKTIERSIQSVLQQTINDLEVVVIDDCSDDNTYDVVKKIQDPRVRFIRLESRSGACAARNRGIDEAKGEYIAFQDSDDKWENNKLEMQLTALRDNRADICSCRVKRHNGEREILFPQIDGISTGFLSHEALCRKSHVSTQTIIASNTVFQRHKFDPLVKKAQDYDWIIRASKEYSVYFINIPLVEQFIQKDSITLSGPEFIIESHEYFLRKYKEECEHDRQFKIYLLLEIAHAKVLSYQSATREYKEVFKLKKTPRTFLFLFLERINLLHFIFKRRLSRKFREKKITDKTAY